LPNSRDDLNDKTETAHRLLARCRTEGRALLERAAIPTGPDGYPRRASGADPTIPSQPPTSPQDESDTGLAISYSDPTGDCVTRRREPDPVKADARRFWRHVLKGIQELEAAGIVLDNQKHILGLATAAGDEDRWCQSCARDGGYRQHVLVGRYARYCGWCGPFYAKYRQEPPLELLVKLHADRRIYDRDIVQALKAPKGRKAG
jgi:hypothetical protein